MAPFPTMNINPRKHSVTPLCSTSAGCERTVCVSWHLHFGLSVLVFLLARLEVPSGVHRLCAYKIINKSDPKLCWLLSLWARTSSISNIEPVEHHWSVVLRCFLWVGHVVLSFARDVLSDFKLAQPDDNTGCIHCLSVLLQWTEPHVDVKEDTHMPHLHQIWRFLLWVCGWADGLHGTSPTGLKHKMSFFCNKTPSASVSAAAWFLITFFKVSDWLVLEGKRLCLSRGGQRSESTEDRVLFGQWLIRDTPSTVKIHWVAGRCIWEFADIQFWRTHKLWCFG